MMKLTMKYVMTCLMHEMSKRKGRKPQGYDVAMVLPQVKMSNPFLCKNIKMYQYCGKPSHIA